MTQQPKQGTRKHLIDESRRDLSAQKIDIRPLKALVKSKQFILNNKAFCETILAEKDFMTAEEFLAKLETWMHLLSLKQD